MPKLAGLCGVALAAALAVAFAAAGGGRAAHRPGLAAAVERTVQAPSMRYAIHVRITQQAAPVTLHIHGRASSDTVSVQMRMGDLHLPDGTVVPGADGAALLDGPFLYERAPSTIAVNGVVRWLRLRVATLSPASEELDAVHAMTPGPLLRVLRAARAAPEAEGAHVYNGTVAHDAPSMRGLARLTGDTDFRRLRISALVGADGLVRRIVLTGRTVDGTTTISLRARLFGFGEPVRVTPPAPGTFLDGELAQTPV
jgi:hypothetical protein